MPETSRTRFEVRRVAETGSTNSDLLALARGGAPEGVVLVADHQTAGRGRLDRSWVAPPGSSLLVSLLLRPAALRPSQLHAVTVAVALAASDALRREAGFEPVLKWPNDLLVDDRKLGGILAESVASGAQVEAVVVGMGLNLNWPDDFPPELAATAVAANQVAGRPVDREAVLSSFLTALEGRYDGLAAPGGLEAQAVEYRARCGTLGREVRVELASGSFAGTATDVTADGHLVVALPDGTTREVTAGDVVHLRPTD